MDREKRRRNYEATMRLNARRIPGVGTVFNQGPPEPDYGYADELARIANDLQNQEYYAGD